MALDKETLIARQMRIESHLARGFPGLFRAEGRPAPVVAVYWPHRNEFDTLPFADRLRASGALTALPVVDRPDAPLGFREWHPGVTLKPGHGGIPYPASGGPEVTPSVLLIPVVGFDAQGFRLGYGGGFFDRTLAAMKPRPIAIGIGYEESKLESIRPQPHDIPMDYVVTEAGIYRRDSAGPTGEGILVFLGAPPEGEPSALSSPVCYAGELDPAYFGEARNQPRNKP